MQRVISDWFIFLYTLYIELVSTHFLGDVLVTPFTSIVIHGDLILNIAEITFWIDY